MPSFRQILFWAHLLTGLLVGTVVLVMSATGVLLTYQRQVTAWADTRGLDFGPPARGAPRLAPDRVLEAVARAHGGDPTAIRWTAGEEAPVEVSFGRAARVLVNGYTGEVLGTGNERVRAFFAQVTAWHRWLGAAGEHRAVGRAITGACNLGFLFLLVSGLYLWWPRNWTRRAFRNVLVFRRGLSGKARDFNWHNVIGFWSALPLAIVVASGAVISYGWASDLVYRLTGEAPPSRSGGAPPAPGGAPVAPEPASTADVAGLLARAQSQMPDWHSITLQLGGAATDPATFSMDAGNGGQPQKRAQLALDRATGEVVRWEPFSSGTPGRRLRSILRFAHTGEVLGLAGQTVAGLVSLGGVIMVWTGMALALRRLLSWRGRRTKQREAAPVRRGKVQKV